MLRVGLDGTRKGGVADARGGGVGGGTERTTKGLAIREGAARAGGVAAEELPAERGRRRALLLLVAVDGGGGPDGGEREEDGDEGQDVGAHFGDVGEVLQDGEDGWAGFWLAWVTFGGWV